MHKIRQKFTTAFLLAAVIAIALLDFYLSSWVALLIAVLLAFLSTSLAAILIYGKIGEPIQRMITVAKLFANGEFSQQIAVSADGRGGINELASTLNMMSGQVRKMMAKLMDEKQKLQAILDKTDDGLIFVDSKETIQVLNPAAARLLGVEAAQMVGRSVIAATLNNQITELVKHVLSTHNPGSLNIQLNRTERISLNVYVAPLTYSEGSSGALVMMHDMTDIRRTDEMRQDFVANVSHELRTPLASIRAMAETIILHAEKDPQIGENFAHKIMAEIDRLSAVSVDLLDLSQIESGQKSLRWEELSLQDVVVNILANVGPLARNKAIVLSSEVSDDTQLYSDRDAVKQILINLVDNAVKYTLAEGRVTIRARQEEGMTIIDVQDTGMGIPAGDLPRIFERFYRVDKARSRASGGTGLGLAIVKHLVESHGGKITVDSTPGEGSIFTFALPSCPPKNNIYELSIH